MSKEIVAPLAGACHRTMSTFWIGQLGTGGGETSRRRCGGSLDTSSRDSATACDPYRCRLNPGSQCFDRTLNNPSVLIALQGGKVLHLQSSLTLARNVLSLFFGRTLFGGRQHPRSER